MRGKSFREHILSGKQILLDGGIGTELYERGLFQPTSHSLVTFYRIYAHLSLHSQAGNLKLR